MSRQTWFGLLSAAGTRRHKHHKSALALSSLALNLSLATVSIPSLAAPASPSSRSPSPSSTIFRRLSISSVASSFFRRIVPGAVGEAERAEDESLCDSIPSKTWTICIEMAARTSESSLFRLPRPPGSKDGEAFCRAVMAGGRRATKRFASCKFRR